MNSPRAWRRPSLFGADWCPLLRGRFVQRTRASPIASTTAPESSVHPSPITSTSKSWSVCRNTLRRQYGSTLLQLNVGMMTDTRGQESVIAAEARWPLSGASASAWITEEHRQHAGNRATRHDFSSGVSPRGPSLPPSGGGHLAPGPFEGVTYHTRTPLAPGAGRRRETSALSSASPSCDRQM